MSEEFEEMFDGGDKRNVFSHSFILKKILGKGAFGTVVSAIQRSDQKEVAVKIFQKTPQNKAQYTHFLKEAEILGQLKHPNIVKFERIIESETRAFLVMEIIKGGQLQEFIDERRKQNRPITDEEAATIMKGIFLGLLEIHNKDIIHRDLKPQNILLADKNNLESIKICDFGLAAQYDPMEQMARFNTRVGTKIFMAPELWQRKQYSKPVDIWSCGIIMYMILSGGKHPVYESGDSETAYWAKLDNDVQIEFPPTFNKYSKDLFFKLFNTDQITRYAIGQIIGHPWITRRFEDDIPLTAPEKMRAFSQSQTLSRMIKSMYIICQLPGADANPDPEHKQKIEENCLKVDFSPLHRRKSSMFADTFKILFTPVPTESNELVLTTAASQPNRESNNSPSPISLGPSNYSPNFSPGFGSQLLLTIPENCHGQKETENTPSASGQDTKPLNKQFLNNDDSFLLPETTAEVPDAKKLQFTISVLPVKYEESTDASNSKGSTSYQKPTSIPSIEEGVLRKSIRIKKISSREREEKDSGGGGLKLKTNYSTLMGNSAESSQVPSPSNKTSGYKGSKRYTFKNTLDAELLDTLKLSQRRDDSKIVIRDQKSRILDSPTNRSIESTKEPSSRPSIAPSNAGKDFSSPDVSRSPPKSRTPLMKRTSKTPKIEDSRPRAGEQNSQNQQNHVRLPSIGLEQKPRTHSVLRSRPVGAVGPMGLMESKVKPPTDNRLSSSPMKTAKNWNVGSREGRNNSILGEKSAIKGQFVSLLEPSFYQTFIKK